MARSIVFGALFIDTDVVEVFRSFNYHIVFAHPQIDKKLKFGWVGWLE